jgi:hypothetical protein
VHRRAPEPRVGGNFPEPLERIKRGQTLGILIQVRGDPAYREFSSKDVAEISRDLPEAEALALRRSLWNHGVHVDAWQSPRAALELLGAQNFERLTTHLVDAPRPETAAADAAVDNIRFLALHNTSAFPREDEAILSAWLIELIGGYGVHSCNTFNRTFLDSKQNVFAFWLPARGNALPEQRDVYGDHSIVFDPDYFAQHGWVSPYAMHPDDLEPVARQVLGEERAEALPMKHEVFDEPPDDWLELRQELWRFDLTPSQFEEAVKRQLKCSMRRLDEENRPEYELALRHLEAGSQEDLEEALTLHGYLPLFGNRFDTAYRRQARETILEKLPPTTDLGRRIRELVEDPSALDTLRFRRQWREIRGELFALAQKAQSPPEYPLTLEVDTAFTALLPPKAFEKIFEAKVPAAVPEYAHEFVPVPST